MQSKPMSSRNARPRARLALCLGTALLALAGMTAAADGPEPLSTQAMPHCHAQGQATALPALGISRSVARYNLPDLSLVGMDGRPVRLADELAGEGPVLVNFIFTSCTTICPVSSSTFAQVQAELDAAGLRYRLVSISIDPEHDSPARLREYADKFHAAGHWHFLTGEHKDIVAVQRAFDAYRGDKMNHLPLVMLRAAPDAPWVRYEGFVSPTELVAEYRRLTAPERVARH